MGKFLEVEKQRQVTLKIRSLFFSDVARADGTYKDKPRPFCLPSERADENLFSEIRQSSMAYFAAQEIKWHDGRDERPSNH
ncbi:MAG: hypothetical protein J7M27_08690, partial [Candidatus Latescibacteria bacterium]|nr:hypothetical protein [Candidatus Latescibacterota bacterium]